MDEPEAQAPQEQQFRLPVDEAHCDRAAQGLRAMAQYQYRSLARRYEEAGWLKRTQRAIQRLAPAIAAIVFVLGLVMAWAGCVDEGQRRFDFVLAALLFLEALAFWLIRGRVERMRLAIRGAFARFFGNRVARMMRRTRRAAPFEAVYDLRGDLLVYSRVEQGRWVMRWHRSLDKLRARGVALQTPGLLAIFAKPGAVVPAMIVLTAGDGAMAAAIRARGWTIVDIDPASGEPAEAAPG